MKKTIQKKTTIYQHKRTHEKTKTKTKYLHAQTTKTINTNKQFKFKCYKNQVTIDKINILKILNNL